MKATYGKRKWSAAKSAHWVWPSRAPAPSTRQDSKLISSCIFCCVTSLPGVMWCGMMNTRWHHNKNNSPKKTYVHNKWLSYVYIILYHNSWTSPWAPPLEWILPKQLLPRGLQQTEIHRIPQGGARLSAHSIHPHLDSTARSFNTKRKSSQETKTKKKKRTTSQSEKNICWFLLLQFTLNMMHPLNIQQTSRQFVSLCSHSHVLVTPAPWKKRCEVLHHLARQVATFVQTQQPQDQRVE